MAASSQAPSIQPPAVATPWAWNQGVPARGSFGHPMRSVATPCRAGGRASSPTFRSNLPFGSQHSSCLVQQAPSQQMSPRASAPYAYDSTDTAQKPFLGSTKARPIQPKASRMLPDELPMAASEILDDRGRRHFSPRAPREPKAGRGLPYARDGDCSPSGGITPRGGESPRLASPGNRDGTPSGAPHRRSDGVASCARLHEDAPVASTRAPSPQQLSPRMRNALQNVEESPEPCRTGRRRGSPTMRDPNANREQTPEARGPRLGPRIKAPAESSGAAGLPGNRARAAAVDAQGWGSMTAAKEAEMEEERLQLRPTVSQKLPREHDALLSHPPFERLSSTELRGMGKAVADANMRLREHLNQGPSVSTRSSLKRTKALSPRNNGTSPLPQGRTTQAREPVSPRNGPASSPKASAHGATSPRAGAPRVTERSATAPRRAAEPAHGLALGLREDVVTASREVAPSAQNAPNFGQKEATTRTSALQEASPLSALSRRRSEEVARESPTHRGESRAQPEHYQEKARSIVEKADAHRKEQPNDLRRQITAPPSCCWPPSRPSSTIRAAHVATLSTPHAAAGNDVSFSGVGEAAFSWQPPDEAAGGGGLLQATRIDAMPVVAEASCKARQLGDTIAPAASPTEVAARLADFGADDLEAIKKRCDELMQKAHKARDVSPKQTSPKPKKSLGGA